MTPRVILFLFKHFQLNVIECFQQKLSVAVVVIIVWLRFMSTLRLNRPFLSDLANLLHENDAVGRTRCQMKFFGPEAKGN